MGAYCSNKKYHHRIFITHFTHKQKFDAVLLLVLVAGLGSSYKLFFFSDANHEVGVGLHRCPPRYMRGEKNIVAKVSQR